MTKPPLGGNQGTSAAPNPRDSVAARFDAQAHLYDARTGFPPGVGERIAGAVLDAAGIGADERVVELGAGTGLIGVPLARLHPAYVGLDHAAEMLRRFAAKGPPAGTLLVRCDLAATWPLRAGAVAAALASRVAHLLDPEHIAAELRRVLRPGGALVLGRVERDPSSLASRLRDERRRLLRAAGLEPRDGLGAGRRLIERLEAAGLTPPARFVAAEWAARTSAGAIIDRWAAAMAEGGLAGPGDQAAFLAALRSWAATTFGGLDREEPFGERYILDLVRCP